MEKTSAASTADMVKDAIKTLGERSGSSLHNIKKYIEAVYQVDMTYRAPRIRKFLRAAVDDGGVVQTSGRGASGSFALPAKQPTKASKAAKAPKAARAVQTGKAAVKPNVRSTLAAARSSGSASSISTVSSESSSASSKSARDERARLRALRR